MSTSGIDFVEGFRAVAGRFADAVAVSDLRAPVPACPGWSTYDLVVHVGNVHAWAATIVETGRNAERQHDEPRSRRRAEAVAEWYVGRAEDLYAVLRDADPDAPTWSFAGADTTASFWSRRQHHETLVHLVDLDQAAGRGSDLDPLVCTDAIAEIFEVFLPRMHARGATIALDEPLTVRTLDTDHVWTLQPRHDAAPAVAVRTEPGADLVEGPAPALLQLLWKRCGTDHPDVGYVGNTDRIERFIASPLTT